MREGKGKERREGERKERKKGKGKGGKEGIRERRNGKSEEGSEEGKREEGRRQKGRTVTVRMSSTISTLRGRIPYKSDVQVTSFWTFRSSRCSFLHL